MRETHKCERQERRDYEREGGSFERVRHGACLEPLPDTCENDYDHPEPERHPYGVDQGLREREMIGDVELQKAGLDRFGRGRQHGAVGGDKGQVYAHRPVKGRARLSYEHLHELNQSGDYKDKDRYVEKLPDVELSLIHISEP